ncbi:MAG: hypothetical protein RIT81_27350 [Deltaproteobacteria bacterium]
MKNVVKGALSAVLCAGALTVAGCCIEDGEGCLENSDCCSGCCTSDASCEYFSISTNVCVSVEDDEAAAKEAEGSLVAALASVWTCGGR